MSTSNLRSINREAFSPGSPRPQVKREPSTGKRRHAERLLFRQGAAAEDLLSLPPMGHLLLGIVETGV